MKECNLLPIAFMAKYDTAAKSSYENTVTNLKSTMTQEFVEIPRSPAGLAASVGIVKNILRMAELQVQGWSVTENLRKSYLQPLHDHGDVLRTRLVSLQSC
jgi:hypothetical protein